MSQGREKRSHGLAHDRLAISLPRMTYLSAQTANKQSITRTITSSVTSHLDELASALGPLLFPGGVSEAVDMRAVCLATAALLQRDYEALAHADREVARERTEDDQMRVQRDEVLSTLREAVFRYRDLVSAVYGAEQVKACGLAGRVPDHPEALVAFARNAAGKLPALAEAQDRSPFIQFDLEAVTADLLAKTERLEASLTSVATDMRETQAAQSQRNQADEAWRRHYNPVASMVESLFRLADMDHQADRVRPTRRRRAGAPEPDDVSGQVPEVALGSEPGTSAGKQPRRRAARGVAARARPRPARL